MKTEAADTYTWIVRNIIEEAPRVRSLFLEADGERPAFISGQYLTVRLPGFLPAEGKSYSISSTHTDALLRLTVKEAGSFSRAILEKKIGDTIETGAPYGFFYPEDETIDNLVFIAGGIGVTPAMSIIESLVERDYPGNLTLFYSNRTVPDVTFCTRLTELSTHPRLSVRHHITREDAEAPYVRGRITGKHVASVLGEKASEYDYFVSGSIDFTKSLWRELRDVGIPANRIYTEGFY